MTHEKNFLRYEDGELSIELYCLDDGDVEISEFLKNLQLHLPKRQQLFQLGFDFEVKNDTSSYLLAFTKRIPPDQLRQELDRVLPQLSTNPVADHPPATQADTIKQAFLSVFGGFTTHEIREDIVTALFDIVGFQTEILFAPEVSEGEACGELAIGIRAPFDAVMAPNPEELILSLKRLISLKKTLIEEGFQVEEDSIGQVMASKSITLADLKAELEKFEAIMTR